MKPNERFFQQIRGVLAAHDLTYTSESDSRLIPCRIPWYRALRWKGEADGVAEKRLLDQYHQNDYNAGWLELTNLFMGRKVVSFVRNTNGDAESDLYLLVSFGWIYVGFQCKLIQT